MSEPWLVVGLGNPGPAYASTRHNIGAMALTQLAARCSVTLSRHRKALAHIAETHVGLPGSRIPIVLCNPQSYMNESGGPVKAALSFYRIPPERLLVLHDELDIDFTAVRLKRGGGDGGHNGLKSIRSAIGTGDYYRIRLGIGRPPGRQAPADFVLQQFSGSQRSELPAFLERADEAAETLVLRGLEVAQNEFHTRQGGDE
ncbi:MAG TPA: aminoacyl-tRNA hydrolase [Candidatus Nanopelagicales bacterium]|nr:aminoacyl-tRNA hydrolase [Candidatus Nanopelagicales bacterium]